MRTIPAALQDHLDSGATTLCWCWRITRNDAVSFGFTDHDRDLDFGGTRYEAASGFTGSEIASAVGLNVDTLDVDGALKSDRLNEKDLAAGLFDNAAIEIYRVNWADPDQRVLMRSGNLGEVSRGAHHFRCEVRGLAHELQPPKGRIIQYGCDADVGDARCEVNLDQAAFSANGTARWRPRSSLPGCWSNCGRTATRRSPSRAFMMRFARERHVCVAGGSSSRRVCTSMPSLRERISISEGRVRSSG